MLYADDMLLLLGDKGPSLRAVMAIISEFGKYSGLTINWTKSALLQLDHSLNPQRFSFCPAPVVRQFRYLRIMISSEIADYCRLNVFPLLSRYRYKVKLWTRLWLSVAGRANLMMILMSQILDFHQQVVIPLKIFRLVN